MGNAALEAFSFLIGMVFNLYAMLLALRFVMQMLRVEYYNPLAQFVCSAGCGQRVCCSALGLRLVILYCDCRSCAFNVQYIYILNDRASHPKLVSKPFYRCNTEFVDGHHRSDITSNTTLRTLNWRTRFVGIGGHHWYVLLTNFCHRFAFISIRVENQNQFYLYSFLSKTP